MKNLFNIHSIENKHPAEMPIKVDAEGGARVSEDKKDEKSSLSIAILNASHDKKY